VRTVVIVNQKGGCGKTTTAINLAGVFAGRGRRSLLVDLDPQSHCAAGLAIPEQRIDLDIADALVSDVPLERARLVWSAGRRLDLIPSRTRLAGLEAARGGLATKPDKERRLDRVLERFAPEYDAALVDCSPSIGLLTYNAILAATDILVPVETGFFSLQGAMKQVKTIESLQRRLGGSAPFWLLPTLHETGSALAEDLLQELRRRFGDLVLPVAIRRDVKLREAVSFGQPVVEYEPESTGARDYGDLADWLIRRWAPQTRPETPAPMAPLPADSYGPARGTDAVTPAPEPVVRPLAQQPAAEIGTVDIGAGEESVPGYSVPGYTVVEPVGSSPAASSMPLAEVKPSVGDDRLSEIMALARKLREATMSAPRAAPPSPPRRSVVTIADEQPAVPRSTPERAVLGARSTNQGVLFVQPLGVGRQVAVAGDFNGWSTRANRLQADPSLGVHQGCVHLPPGRHRYRLVIDGRWSADPHNPVAEPNEFGEVNSVIVVTAPVAAAVTA
jgi:chromosome partitioning protein